MKPDKLSKERITEELKLLLSYVNDGLKKIDPDKFSQAQRKVRSMKGMLREEIQRILWPAMEAILEKLRTEQNLTKEEIKILRGWVVGDAEYYSQMENNFKDWIKEVKRLAAELSKFQSMDMDESDLRKLQALLTDLHNTLGNLIAYLEVKERVSRFDKQVSEGIKGERAKVLIGIIQSMMVSEEM